jgi:hypothetical protein
MTGTLGASTSTTFTISPRSWFSSISSPTRHFHAWSIHSHMKFTYGRCISTGMTYMVHTWYINSPQRQRRSP